MEGNDNLLEQVKMETFVRKKMEIVMADPASIELCTQIWEE